MKKIILAIITAVSFGSVFSQVPGGGRNMGGQQMAGRFYGKVVDEVGGKGVDAASIQLIQNKMDTATKKRADVVINGMLTKSNGEFTLENVPLFGQYKLKITAIGFKPYEETIRFDLKMGPGGTPDMSAMLNAIDKDLGNIKLEVDAQVLGNVTVAASKPLLQLGIDRKIYNVDKNIVSAGGTAVDVMRNVPSLSVDLDGNVSLRNNAPQIFVDGRPTTMQLDQIPADAIESVEIITNPSAKFDASGGTSGILNVVLKKNKKVGYNGGLRTNVDSRGRVGFGGDINIRQNKLNLFASANYNQRKSISTGTTDRFTLLDSTDLNQSDRSVMLGSFAFGRAGFDYFMSNRNTFSASFHFGRGSFEPNSISNIFIDSLKTGGSSYSQRNSNSNNEFRNMGTTLSFKHNFPKAGREITADATINSRKNENNNIIQTDYYKLPGNILDRTYSQQQLGNGNSKSIVIQTDYTDPLSDKSKIEMGVRAYFNEVNSRNNFYTYNGGTGQYEYIQALSNLYESNDRVIAAYATYSNMYKKFGYQVGLRAESSNYEGRLPDKNQDFKIDFPLSFFPSVFLSQKMEKDQELQLNYSRRINRPNFWQLFPFTDYSDSLNLSRGNPTLNPEFTNSVELSYQKIFKNKDNFLASIYYKNTNNLISRYQVVEQNPITNKDVLINTYINANSSYVTGLEMTMKNKITKWWELTSNLNLFTSKITIDDPSVIEQDQFASWFGKLNNSFKLPKNISIQLSGEYQSRTVLPPGGSGGGGRGGFGGMFGSSSSAQGYVRPNYYVDAAIRYEFLKNRTASVSLNVNDIFRTRRSYVHSESPYFVQDVFRRRDPQILRLNFSWRFGKFDPNLFKRKNTKGERESMNNMDVQF